MSSLTIYQAVSNAYDKPLPPKGLHPTVDYQIVVGKVPRADAPLWNRYHKIQRPPQFRSSSIYMDGNIGVKDPEKIHFFAKAWLNYVDIALFRHPNRTCAYVEIEACLGRNKITKEEAERAHKLITDSGLKRNFGLWACGVIVRRSHIEWLQKLQRMWFGYCATVCRDQLWLPVCLHRMGDEVPWDRIMTIDDDIFSNRYFTYTSHLKGAAQK